MEYKTPKEKHEKADAVIEMCIEDLKLLKRNKGERKLRYSVNKEFIKRVRLMVSNRLRELEND